MKKFSLFKHHAQVVNSMQSNAETNHDAIVYRLKEELANAENKYERHEHRANRLWQDYQEAEEYCRVVNSERDEALARAENAAGKPNLEIAYLRNQLERTKETHAVSLNLQSRKNA